MKVLDLLCTAGHGFEGWFASLDDFEQQRQRGLIDCPLCGSHDVSRRPSAPRLNLSGVRADDAAAHFVREWRPGVFPPERHYAYAFTWFAFGAAVVAIFVVLHWRRPTSAT